MKKILLLWCTVLVLNSSLFAQLVTIGSPSTQYTYAIFNMQDPYTRYAALYTSSEIGTSGTITDLGWNIKTIWHNGDGPVRIYLKQIPSNSLSSDTWANIKNGATLVYDGTVTFPATANNTWFTINLSTAFAYTSGNLLVLVESNYGGSGNGNAGGDIDFCAATVSGKSQFWWGNPLPSTGTMSTLRPIFQITFDISSGINEMVTISDDNFTIYPNPGNQNMEYKIPPLKNATLTIYSTSGKMVYCRKINGENLGTIDVSKFSKGCYLVRIANDEVNMYQKFIVE